MKQKTFIIELTAGNVNAGYVGAGQSQNSINDHIDEKVNAWFSENPGIRLTSVHHQCVDYNQLLVIYISILYNVV